MKRFIPILALPILLLPVACGGGSTSASPAAPQAKGLTYTDPQAGPGDWQLMKDATSTGTHLVLNLVGPSDGTKYRGAGFTLQVDTTKVKIARFSAPDRYYVDAGVFLDKQEGPTGVREIPPTLQAGGVSGDKLMVGIYQKADDQNWNASTFQYGAPFTGSTAKDCHQVVLQVALDFDAELKAQPGPVGLAALKAKVIPELIDTPAHRQLKSVALKVGTLALN
ncbi:MAG TPA: hypothetical protein VJ570_04410 [Holophagaceae bacterium]|nr:hypothetical protein [Holophagaceae bacterium]